MLLSLSHSHGDIAHEVTAFLSWEVSWPSRQAEPLDKPAAQAARGPPEDLESSAASQKHQGTNYQLQLTKDVSTKTAP